MKKEYTMPEIVITSFEADSNIMKVSSVTTQSNFDQITYQTLQ